MATTPKTTRDDKSGGQAQAGRRERERRCVATGDVLPEAELIRFVKGPDGALTPDLAAKLPGRGAWLRADRASLDKAVKKRAFERALGTAPVEAAQLAADIEALLKRRLMTYIQLARRAGETVCGFDSAAAAVKKSPGGVAVLFEASDGAADGRRKLFNALRAAGCAPLVIGVYDSAELGLAFGRTHVIHAVLMDGALRSPIELEAARLAGFVPLRPSAWSASA